MAGLGFEMRAVDAVAHQGGPDMGEMDPDLVGTASLQLAGEQGRDRLAVARVKRFLHLPMGDRLAATLADRHFFPGVRMAVDWRLDRAALAVRHTPHKAQKPAGPPPG